MPDPKALIVAPGHAADELSSIAGNGAPHAIPIGNRPLVAYAFDAVRGAGIDDIGIVVCARSEHAVRHALGDRSVRRVTWISAAEPLGFADSLLAAADFLGASPFVVHFGDAIVLDPLRPSIDELLLGDTDAVLLDVLGAGHGGGLQSAGRRAAPLPHHDDLAGAHVFGRHALEAAALAHELGGDDGPVGVASALLQLGGNVVTRSVASSWSYHGSVDHLLDANRMVLDSIEARGRQHRGEDVRIEGRVHLHPSVELERTIIRGPAVVGREAVLTDAYVGPYSAIGDRVHVQGAEVENSIIMAGAMLRHPGHRVEASVVGEDATVSREFGLPSTLRLRVGRRTQVWLG